jgi:hypothetical protein
LGEHLGYKSLEAFYTMTNENVGDAGGKGLLENVFYGSIAKALASVYPFHSWLPWQFTMLPPSTHKDRYFLDNLGRELGFKDMKDWYSISKMQICRKGGASLLIKYGNSPAMMVMSLYNDYPWEKSSFKKKPPLLRT